MNFNTRKIIRENPHNIRIFQNESQSANTDYSTGQDNSR